MTIDRKKYKFTRYVAGVFHYCSKIQHSAENKNSRYINKATEKDYQDVKRLLETYFDVNNPGNFDSVEFKNDFLNVMCNIDLPPYIRYTILKDLTRIKKVININWEIDMFPCYESPSKHKLTIKGGESKDGVDGIFVKYTEELGPDSYIDELYEGKNYTLLSLNNIDGFINLNTFLCHPGGDGFYPFDATIDSIYDAYSLVVNSSETKRVVHYILSLGNQLPKKPDGSVDVENITITFSEE